MTNCRCSGPGFCSALNRQMGPVPWKFCREQPGAFETMKDGPVYRGESVARAEKPNQSVCVHRGEESRRQECPSCSGTVQLKVFACAKHGECTIGKSLDGIACCKGCADFSPP